MAGLLVRAGPKVPWIPRGVGMDATKLGYSRGKGSSVGSKVCNLRDIVQD